MTFLRTALTALLLVVAVSAANADLPSVSYIFPAGGQRGTTVDFRVGGCYLFEGTPFRMDGPGVTVPDRIERGDTLWFEGPVIPQPASQRNENYPKDYRGKATIAADAPVGSRLWRVWSPQGVTPGMQFVVGDLPEIIENEVDGRPVPTPVTLPVTINGRIFPREDVDVWTFEVKKGQVVTCEVNAARLGSELDSRIELHDASGRLLWQNGDAIGNDSRLRMHVLEDGRYSVHIYDESFGGLQNYVYRLTITAGPWIDSAYPLGGRRGTSVPFELRGANLPANPVSIALPADASFERFEHRIGQGASGSNPVFLDLDDLPETVETRELLPPNYVEKELLVPQPYTIAAPAVANGRIDYPGDVDLWLFEATKGTAWQLDLKASRLGSSLDSVITLLDATGKTLATNDDLGPGQTDSRLLWTAPADGVFTVRVEDRLASRGDQQFATFAYRLRIAPAASIPPDYRITAVADALTVERGKNVNLKLNVERLGGFADEIDLSVTGLPEGVTVNPAKVAKGQANAQLTFAAAATARVQVAPLVIQGKAKVGESEIVRSVTIPVAPGTPDTAQIFLAVAFPTPFKFAGAFETKFAPRGGVYVRRYKVERNGFDGPLEVGLADRQNRHLQGVTGPTIVVPAGATEFEYAVTFPPWMEIGRTSRSCLMAVGVVNDADGVKHKVSYSSEQQNDQIIALVDPARLGLTVANRSLRAEPGGRGAVPFEVARGVGLSGPVTVSLVIPRHMAGIRCEPVTLPADARRGELMVQFDAGEIGPFNMPLVLRASMNDERGLPMTNETSIDVVRIPR